MFRKNKSKKGASPLMMVMFAILVGVIVLIGMQFRGGADSPRTLAVVGGQQSGGGSPQAGQPVTPISLVEDVTVTFSSFDFYSIGTNAGTGHRILRAGDGGVGGDINIQVNDDATRTYSPGQSYTVLLGNVTSGLITTSYYPVYLSGAFPDKGTFTVTKGQYNVAHPFEMTDTFFNDADTAGTAQAIGINGKKTVKFRLTAPDNECMGNPDAGLSNTFNYHYNSSNWNNVVQLGSDGNDLPTVSTPTSATKNATYNQAGRATKSFPAPIICDNQMVDTRVRVESGDTDIISADNINVSVSDASLDFNADTFELIRGYVDEDNNDLGFSDSVVTNLEFT